MAALKISRALSSSSSFSSSSFSSMSTSSTTLPSVLLASTFRPTVQMLSTSPSNSSPSFFSLGKNTWDLRSFSSITGSNTTKLFSGVVLSSLTSPSSSSSASFLLSQDRSLFTFVRRRPPPGASPRVPSRRRVRGPSDYLSGGGGGEAEEAASAVVEEVVPSFGSVPLKYSPSPLESNYDALNSVFGHSSLIAVREVEWGTTIVGYEQSNKYTLRDLNGTIVGYMAEVGSNIIYRTLFRSHRGFEVHIFDVNGQPLIKLSRPIKFINSYMKAEDTSGNEICQVNSVWHLFRRRYALYTSHEQFAVIDAGFLYWDFTLLDENSAPLAHISRKWSGVGTEFFTNAGTYVIHFELPEEETGGDRKLYLEERIAAFATAVGIDFDYFTRSGGGFFPFFL